MWKLIAVLLALVAGASAQTCSDHEVVDVEHSVVRIKFKNTAQTYYWKVKWATDAYYVANGNTYLNTDVQMDTRPGVPAGSWVVVTISGLSSATTYHYSAVSSVDNVTFCADIDNTFTTSAAVTHPAAPTLPDLSWNPHTVTPRTGTAYTVGVSPGCSTLKACMENVATASGDTIKLAQGSTHNLTVAGTIFPPRAPDAKQITATSSAADEFTSTAHGLAVNDPVQIAGQYATPKPINAGYTYYVANVGSANTFKVSETLGGAVVDITDTEALSLWFVKLPRPAWNEILITTDYADSERAPDGVRVFESLESTMATLQLAEEGDNNGFIRFREGVFSRGYRVKNIRHTILGNAVTGAADALAYKSFYAFGPHNSDIVIDQIILRGKGYPNRVETFIGNFDGRRMAMINSIVDNWNYWQPFNYLMTNTVTSGTVLTLEGGATAKQYQGHQTCARPSNLSCTITAGGGVTGIAHLWMDSACGTHIQTPTGMSLSCSPGITHSTAATPAFPSSGSLYTAWPLGRVTISAGTWNVASGFPGPCCEGSFAKASPYVEGATTVTGISQGPGPFTLENNDFLNSVGFAFFSTGDNNDKASTCISSTNVTCPALFAPQNIVIRRNNWRLDPSFVPNVSNASWNGRHYGMRHVYECKSCQFVLMEGNITDGNFSDVNAGHAFGLSPLTTLESLLGVSNQTVRDVTLRYNTLKNSSGFATITGRYPGNQYVGKPTMRVHIHDNLVYGLNGWTQSSTWRGTAQQGSFLNLYFGPSDIWANHNTVNVMRGAVPAIALMYGQKVEGLVVQDNIFGISQDGDFRGIRYGSDAGQLPDVHNTRGEAALNAVAPGYVFSRNAMIAGYSNSNSGTEIDAAGVTTLAGHYPGLTLYWPGSATLSARLGTVAWASATNYRLKALASGGSAYCSGCGTPASDKLDMGADIEALEAAQGKVTNARALAITSTTAQIHFRAPTTVGCTVDYGTSPTLATFTRVANAGGNRLQSVSLSALTPATAYTWRVNCQSEQPTGTFTTP